MKIEMLNGEIKASYTDNDIEDFARPYPELSREELELVYNEKLVEISKYIVDVLGVGEDELERAGE